MPNLSESQFQELFSITSVKQIESFLADIGVSSGNGWKWAPLGDRPNNAGSVNLAVEPGQALVERITNAMDAHIELQYELRKRPGTLDSPRSAVNQLWDLDAGRLSREAPRVDRFIDEMAPKTVVRVVDAGEPRESSIIVKDSGIGQHPEDFPDTLLSLGESNKIRKPHLMGAFGQGGSSTFAYCPYSIVVSRRHSSCLDGRPDLVGWTVVRKYDHDSLKVFRYEYLVEDNNRVPTVVPSSREPLASHLHAGTYIIHIAYDLGKLRSQWSLVGYRYFDNLLFDPVLPYRIEDHRATRKFNRNLAGARNRLDQIDPARRPESQNYEVDLERWGGEGRLKIRYWVFRPAGDSPDGSEDERGVQLDSYLDYNRSPRTIVFTLNGQRHHAQEKRIVRAERKAALANYLLMHVDCDGLSRRLKKEIFPATRAGATAGERREELLIRAVKDALSDPWLRRKMEEIVRHRQARITDESTRRVKQLLDSLISVFRTEQRAGGQGGPDDGGSSRIGEEQRQTSDPPTVFRFADHKRLEIHRGETKTIYLLTDGPDNLLSRRKKSGQISLSCEGEEIASFTVAGMNKGRIALHVHIPNTVPSGCSTRINATLRVEPWTYLTTSRELRVVPPPPPYIGIDPPTQFEFATGTPLVIESERNASAEIHTDATNEVLERAVNPASIHTDCDISGVFVTVRGPRDGKARAEVHAGPEAAPETEGHISVILSLEDGTTFTTSRPCKIISAKEHKPRSGVQKTSIPSYEIVRVWRTAPENEPKALTWTDLSTSWNEDRVGNWEMNGDELHLYVNMDERQFLKERLRLNRGFDEGYAQMLADRHVAYLAFHLFQLHEQFEAQNTSEQQSQSEEATGNEENNVSESDARDDPDSWAVNRELQRVTATLIQTLKSEAELKRLEAETNDQ